MDYRRLGKTGWKVSVLSLGSSALSGAFGLVSEKDCIQTIGTAIDLGINFIDTSLSAAPSKPENVLGKALRAVPRQKYYLAAKVGHSGPGETDYDFSAVAVTRSVDEGLRRLRLAHIDLIQCQDIEFAHTRQIVEETLPALRKLKQQGKIHKIGLTGFPLKAFRNILGQVEVDTVQSYGHYCLNDITLVQMFPYFQAKNLGLINAAPLGMGLFTLKGPPKWHPAPARIRDVCAQVVEHCKKKKTNLPRLALQFALANRDIATTLAGVSTARKLKEMVRWLEQGLDLPLLAKVQELLKPIQNKTWPSGLKENN